MPPSAVPQEWELPKLRYSMSFEDDQRYFDDVGPDTDFFDVKFYPYSPVGSNPVFAAVSKRIIFICRLSQTKDKNANPCEVIQVIRDDDPGALNCSCTWTQDPVTQQALLCVGGRDAKVKIYRARDGKPVASFVGHGGEINDLATSPANRYIIASASDDTTVRIWSLDPVHKRQPCLCLLAGEGHSWNLLSVSFHDSGRYVLSAGHDQVINLWVIPDFPREHIDTPYVVQYPHFSTSEIHTGLIDCVAFYGDLILSRACYEDVIVLWRIEGFSSADEPPAPEQAPSNHDTSKLTRSAFSSFGTTLPAAATPVTSSTQPQYTRLIQLHTPGCGPQFFMRFGLYHEAGHHPALAFCNAQAKIFFWDFACFPAYKKFITAIYQNQPSDSEANGGGNNTTAAAAPAVTRPPWLRLVAPRRRQATNGAGNNNNNNNNHPFPRRGDTAARLRETSIARGIGDGVAASDKDSVFSMPLGTATGSVAGTTTAGGAGPSGGLRTSVSTPDPDKMDSSTSTTQRPASAASGTTLPSSGVFAPSALAPVSAQKAGREFYNTETLEEWKHKYDLSDPHALLKAHKTETTKGLPTVGRQVAWSPEGEWCVVVGIYSRVLILQRWAHGEGGAHAAEDGE